MSTDLSPPDTQIKQGRLYTSNVVHIIDVNQPKHPDFMLPESLCGIRPIWPGDWFPIQPIGNEDCRNCKARLEAMSRDNT